MLLGGAGVAAQSGAQPRTLAYAQHLSAYQGVKNTTALFSTISTIAVTSHSLHLVLFHHFHHVEEDMA